MVSVAKTKKHLETIAMALTEETVTAVVYLVYYYSTKSLLILF